MFWPVECKQKWDGQTCRWIFLKESTGTHLFPADLNENMTAGAGLFLCWITSNLRNGDNTQ